MTVDPQRQPIAVTLDWDHVLAIYEAIAGLRDAAATFTDRCEWVAADEYGRRAVNLNAVVLHINETARRTVAR